MASGSSSYAMSAVAAAAAPRAVPQGGAGRPLDGVLPPEIHGFVQDFLSKKDFARLREVSKFFNDPAHMSAFSIARMNVRRLYRLGWQPTPFGREYWLDTRFCTLRDLLLKRYGFDTQCVLALEKKLTPENAAEKGVPDAFVQTVRRLAAPVTRGEKTMIMVRPLVMVPIAFCGEVMRYSYSAYPQLSATVIAMTAAWIFLDPDLSRPFHLVPRSEDYRSGHRRACSCMERRHYNRFIDQMEHEGRSLLGNFVYDAVARHRFRTVAENIARALPPIRVIALLGGVTLFLRLEEALIRPALPTLVSTITSVIISGGPMLLLGAGVGLGAAYLAKKWESHFWTAETHPFSPF